MSQEVTQAAYDTLHTLYITSLEETRQIAAELEAMRERAELSEARLAALAKVIEAASS